MTGAAPTRRLLELIARLTGRWLAPLLLGLLRLSSRRAGAVLLFHGVGRDVAESDELVPAVGRFRFRWNLRHLRRWYTVVPPERILDATEGRRRGERFPVCVTFDDDLPEHADHALPELLAQEVPATFFLGGNGLRGMAQSAWWQRLQRAADRGVPPSQVASLLPPEAAAGLPVGVDIGTLSDAIIELSLGERDRVSAELLELAGPDPPAPALDRDGIRRLVDSGFGVGFHTRTHDPLPQLGESDLKRALRENRAELEELAGKIEAIAYPFGFADRRVADAARSEGFALGFTCEQAAVTPSSEPLLLGRSEWPHATRGEFALRLMRILWRAA